MTETMEGVAPVGHDDPNDDCPFCPGSEKPTWTTYPGKANSSKKLGSIMNDPSKLTSLQSNARPKDGKEDRQGPAKKRAQPSPIYRDSQYGAYSCEAHHAISGNQILKGHPAEKLVVKGTIKKDTGYSVNNSDNGVWLPSVPERLKGKWGGLRVTRKLAIASKPMAAGKGQFHKGPHDITDPEDVYGKYHWTYPRAGKKKLADLLFYVVLWSDECFLCEDVDRSKGPFPPPYRVNQHLDNISESLGKHMLASGRSWRFFISTVAMLFHKKTCRCGHST